MAQAKRIRELSAAEAELMNVTSANGEALQALVGVMRSRPGMDPRWIDIGQTHLQQGLMALRRAVARPEVF